MPRLTITGRLIRYPPPKDGSIPLNQDICERIIGEQYEYRESREGRSIGENRCIFSKKYHI